MNGATKNLLLRPNAFQSQRVALRLTLTGRKGYTKSGAPSNKTVFSQSHQCICCKRQCGQFKSSFDSVDY